MDNLPNTITVDTKFSLNPHRPEPPAPPQPPPIKKKIDKKVKYGVVIVALLVLFLLLGGGFYYISRSGIKNSTSPQVYYQSEPVGVLKLENCYLFASPLQAKAGSGEKIRITVFLLDDRGKGVANKNVVLAPDSRLTITPVQTISDNLGRSIFDLSSSEAGDYFISASVDRQAIPQQVRLSFK